MLALLHVPTPHPCDASARAGSLQIIKTLSVHTRDARKTLARLIQNDHCTINLCTHIAFACAG